MLDRFKKFYGEHQEGFLIATELAVIATCAILIHNQSSSRVIHTDMSECDEGHLHLEIFHKSGRMSTATVYPNK